MPTVHVNLAERSYDVIVERGIIARAAKEISKVGLKGKCAIISDSTVAPLHSAGLLESLESHGFSPSMHIIPAGESSKSMVVAQELCENLSASGHDRKSFVIALGGGVVGDLAGFVAAMFYRGIPFVQIPTTIVSLVDSSVGGKTGVNLAAGKNLVGAFHQPRLVLVDPETLATLPQREYQQGMAEVIKHAAIRDAAMLEELADLDPLSRVFPDSLIARNIAIKARVVEADEQETLGVRALLNFGHTIGHGIEASVAYGELLHGEAISLGMRAALYLSEKRAGLDANASAAILRLQKKFHLPLVLDGAISTEAIMKKIQRDKKFSAGTIQFVLLDRPGNAIVSKDVTAADMEEAIEFLRQPIA
jgi:3-dehydroquinate synthase